MNKIQSPWGTWNKAHLKSGVAVWGHHRGMGGDWWGGVVQQGLTNGGTPWHTKDFCLYPMKNGVLWVDQAEGDFDSEIAAFLNAFQKYK